MAIVFIGISGVSDFMKLRSDNKILQAIKFELELQSNHKDIKLIQKTKRRLLKILEANKLVNNLQKVVNANKE